MKWRQNRNHFWESVWDYKLLFEGSEESEGVEGLHLLDGEILRIPEQEGLKIPNIGWNSLDLQNNGRLFENLNGNPFVYFVHSYYLKAREESIVKATIEHKDTYSCVCGKR